MSDTAQPIASDQAKRVPDLNGASGLKLSLFTNNPEPIYEAFLKVLKKGSPYGFHVLSDRAFGKLKEVHQIEHSPYSDVSEEDLHKRLKELQEELGFQPSEPKILPPADDDTQVQ